MKKKVVGGGGGGGGGGGEGTSGMEVVKVSARTLAMYQVQLTFPVQND